MRCACDFNGFNGQRSTHDAIMNEVSIETVVNKIYLRQTARRTLPTYIVAFVFACNIAECHQYDSVKITTLRETSLCHLFFVMIYLSNVPNLFNLD